MYFISIYNILFYLELRGGAQWKVGNGDFVPNSTAKLVALPPGALFSFE